MTDAQLDEIIRQMETGVSYADARADVRAGDAMALIDELNGLGPDVEP